MHQLHVNANQHKYWLDNEIFVEDKRLKSLEVHIRAVVVSGHHGMGNEKWQPVISPYTQARYHFPSWLQEQLPAPVCPSPSTLSLINTLQDGSQNVGLLYLGGTQQQSQPVTAVNSWLKFAVGSAYFDNKPFEFLPF